MAQRRKVKRSLAEDGARNSPPTSKRLKQPGLTEHDKSFQDINMSQLQTQDIKETDVNLVRYRTLPCTFDPFPTLLTQCSAYNNFFNAT